MSHWSALLEKNLGPDHDSSAAEAAKLAPTTAAPEVDAGELDAEFEAVRRARLAGRPRSAWAQAASPTKTERSAPLAAPLGDYRVSAHARERRFQDLMGAPPAPQPRRELVNDPLLPSHRPRTAMEIAAGQRAVATEKAKQSAFVALRRDAAAWSDAEGYAKVHEVPTFRDGLNPTLRIKPPPADALRGLAPNTRSAPAQLGSVAGGAAGVLAKAEIKARRAERAPPKTSGRAAEFAAAQSRAAEGLVRRDNTNRSQIAKAVGAHFVRGVAAPLGVGGQSDPTLDTTRRRPDELIETAVGSAFVELGMTLPAGPRDDPLKNDTVALEMGTRVMEASSYKAADAPLAEGAFRREVALALGRALLHLQSAAEAGRGDAPLAATTKESTSQRQQQAVGRIALGFVDAAAARVGKTLVEDQKRREVLSAAIAQAIDAVVVGARSEDAPVVRALSNNPALNKRALMPGHDAPPPSLARQSGFTDRRGEKGRKELR